MAFNWHFIFFNSFYLNYVFYVFYCILCFFFVLKISIVFYHLLIYFYCKARWHPVGVVNKVSFKHT